MEKYRGFDIRPTPYGRPKLQASHTEWDLGDPIFFGNTIEEITEQIDTYYDERTTR